MAKLRLGSDIVQSGKTRYIWGVNLFKMLKQAKEKKKVRLKF